MQSGQVRLAVVMDPIGAIKPAKDTTLAMLLAAQRRGWSVEYLELRDLWLRGGGARGRWRIGGSGACGGALARPGAARVPSRCAAMAPTGTRSATPSSGA